MADLGKAELPIEPGLGGFGALLQRELLKVGTKGPGLTALENNLGKPIDGLRSKIGAVGVLLGGAALVGGFKKAIDQTVQWGSDVKSLTRNLGVSSQEASALALAAEHYGLGVDQLSKGLGIFEKHIVAGDKASQSLGITFRDNRGQLLPFNTILEKTSGVFQKLPDGPQKTALALNLFGRSGRALIPFLNAGPEAMRKFSEEAHKFGLSLTGANLTTITNYKFAMRDFGASVKGLEVQLGLHLLPVLTQFLHVAAGGVQLLESIPAPVFGAAAAFGGFVLAVRLATKFTDAARAAFVSVFGGLRALIGAHRAAAVAAQEQGAAESAAAGGTRTAGIASEELAVSLGKAAGFAQALAESLGAVATTAGGVAETETAAAAATEAQGAAALQAAIALQGEAAAALDAEAAQVGLGARIGGTLARLAPLGIALGGTALLVGIFAKAHQQAQERVDAFTTALENEKRGVTDSLNIAIIDKFKSQFGSEFQNLVKAGPGALTIALKEISTGGTEAFQALARDAGPLQIALGKAFGGTTAPQVRDIIGATNDLGGSVKVTRREIEATQKAMAALGNNEALNKLTDQFTATSELNDVLSRLEQRGLPAALAAQFRQMGADGLFAAQQLNAGNQDAIKSFIALAREAGVIPPALDKQGEAIARLERHYRTASDSVDRFQGRLKITLGGLLDVQDATARYDQDLAAMGDSLKANGRSFDLNTEKGRNNSQALRTVVGDIEDQIGALVRSGKESSSETHQKDLLLRKLRDLERRYPALKGQIDTYIAAVNKTPASKTTTIKLAVPSKKDVDAKLEGFARAAADAKVQLAMTPHFTTPSMSVQATNITVSGYRSAEGRIVRAPMFSLLGEEGDEAVIPLGADKKARRRQLLEESGILKELLGSAVKLGDGLIVKPYALNLPNFDSAAFRALQRAPSGSGPVRRDVIHEHNNQVTVINQRPIDTGESVTRALKTMQLLWTT